MWCEQLEGDVRASQLRQTEDKKALELSETERKSLVFQVDELRSAVDKAKAESETLQRAKKSLEAQLDRMNDELGEDGRNVSETRKVNKKLESTIERVREPALTDAAGREWVPPPCLCAKAAVPPPSANSAMCTGAVRRYGWGLGVDLGGCSCKRARPSSNT